MYYQNPEESISIASVLKISKITLHPKRCVVTQELLNYELLDKYESYA